MARKKSIYKGELGSVGRSYSSLFDALGSDEYLSELRWPQNAKIYERMRRSDAQIQAMLLIIELPIRSTEWFIEPYDDDEESATVAEAIKENLFSGPPHGMSIHWDDFLRQALTMLPFGAAVFEKVFKKADDGEIKWRKFGPRPLRTIYEFLYDEEGGPLSINHMKVSGMSYEMVEIPIDKLLIFTNRMEGGDLTGNSILRTAYKHWRIKDHCYKLMNIGIERFLVGTPVMRAEEGHTPEDEDKAKKILEDLRSAESGGVHLPPHYSLDIFEGKRQMMEVMPYIEHHDLMISRSVLAHFINLGSGEVGSYALSEDQSNLFLMTLNATAKYIANIVNSYAIPQLVDLNWEVEGYPRLDFKPIGQSSGMIIETLQNAVTGQLVTPDEDLETYIREMMGLPEAVEKEVDEEGMPVEDTEEEPEKAPETDEIQEIDEEEIGSEGQPSRRQEHPQQLSEIERITLSRRGVHIPHTRWHRHLTPYEKRVRFEDIANAWDIAENRYVREGQKICERQLRDLFKRVAAALERGDYDAIAKIPVRYKGQFTKFLEEQQMEMFLYGAQEAAYELGVTEDVSIPHQVRKTRRTRSGVVADLITSRIKTVFVLDMLNAIDGGITATEALNLALTSALDSAAKELKGSASVQIGDAINTGRNLTAEKVGAKLAQFSAILDTKVCPLCEEIDGMIIERTDPDYEKFTPRIHQNCRCLWVYIHPEETPQPDVTWESPDPVLVEEYGSLVK